MGEGIHTIQQRTDRSYQRDTEKGMNRQEAYTVSKLESKIRDRKTEKGYIIGSDGKIIGESFGSGRQAARFHPWDMQENAIVIHNHPYKGNGGRGLYDTRAGRVGVPFSPSDIELAVKNNLKEIRAVTPTYTWSMRRPKGGWGKVSDIMGDLNRYIPEFARSTDRYYAQQARSVTSAQRAKELNDRANVVTQYGMMKNLAKKYGWEFTRRKVK